MAPSFVKLEDSDLAFAVDLPEKVPGDKVRSISLLEILRSNEGNKLKELMMSSGKLGRELDIYFMINSDNCVVGIEILR